MAEDEAIPDTTPDGQDEAPKKSKKNLITLLLVILNFLGFLGVLGFFYYTEFIYKRPSITEKSERERLTKEYASFKATENQFGFVKLDKIQANLMPNPGRPESKEGADQQLLGTINRLSIDITLQINSVEKLPQVEQIKSMLYDRVLTLLGNKTFYELNNIQGRYVLRSQILGIANDLLKERVIIDVFFSDFILQ
jgi:flagellar basal body-associated protein FliL